MAKPQEEEPEGLVYRRGLVSEAEERALLERLASLRFDPIRERAAELAGLKPDDFVEALVQRYPAGSTIGWHRDAPAFGIVVGISLGGPGRLRFQRGKGEHRRVWDLLLEPRSGYVLAGEARSSWQHSIPPTKELRFSIT